MGGSNSKIPVKKPVPAISDIDRAVLDLKNSRDRLHRYRLKLERDDTKLLEQAVSARTAGQTKKALGILRLRKYKQVQADACEDQLLTVLQLVETIGSKQNQAAVLDAMAAGKDTLKKMHDDVTVDDVLGLMDQITEENEKEQEINEILMGVPTMSSELEDAVAAELAALESSMMAENSAAETTTKPTELPVAPTTKLPETMPAVPATTAVRVPEKRVAVPS